MKKILIAVLLTAAVWMVVSVYAADISLATRADTPDYILKARLASDLATVQDQINTNTAVIVSGGAASLLLQTGTATGAQLVVFTIPFGAAPKVFLQATNLHAVATTNLYATTGNARTNFVTLIDNPGFNWLAVGQK